MTNEVDPPALCHKAILGWLRFLENIHMIVCHLFLCYEDFLTAIDDKVATLRATADTSCMGG